MQELVEIPLCINVVAKEMDEVSCSRMTWGEVLQSERNRSRFCPVVSHANVVCTTPPHHPSPQAVIGFLSAGNTIGFFYLHSFIHVFDLVCIKRIVCVSANVISVTVFCLFKIQHSNDFKVESFLYLLELSSFTDSSN